MSNILFVTSSARRAGSYSNQVASALVEKLEAATAGAIVTVRDLARSPFPISTTSSSRRPAAPAARRPTFSGRSRAAPTPSSTS